MKGLKSSFQSDDLFFIEKRELFSTDSNFMFTRRIVDPEGGIRLTGREGDYGFGGILINDAAPGLNRAADDPLSGEKANIAIVRVSKTLGIRIELVLAAERQLGDGYNRVLSLDSRIKFTDNWFTQLQVIGTESEPSMGGTATGYREILCSHREGRTYRNHTHCIETTSDFKSGTWFQNRYFRSNTSGCHQSSTINFYSR